MLSDLAKTQTAGNSEMTSRESRGVFKITSVKHRVATDAFGRFAHRVVDVFSHCALDTVHYYFTVCCVFKFVF